MNDHILALARDADISADNALDLLSSLSAELDRNGKTGLSEEAMAVYDQGQDWLGRIVRFRKTLESSLN